MTAMLPELLWAQRSNATEAEKNLVYLTVKVADLANEEIKLTSTEFSFTGKSRDQEYAVKFEWFDEIDVDNSKQTKTGQGLLLVIRKKNPQEEYWPRLTKDKVRRPNVHTDFDKWVDEDEQEEAPEVPEGMDMGGMGGMPGMGGDMGGEGGDMNAQMAQLQAMLAGQGGAGGAGGFDMASLMGGAGGAGGAGGFDMSSLMGGQGTPDDGAEIEEANEEEPEEAEAK